MSGISAADVRDRGTSFEFMDVYHIVMILYNMAAPADDGERAGN
jgi:hypothetical protein